MPAGCELYINGEGAAVAQTGRLGIGQRRQLQFSFATQLHPPHGELKFKVVLVTKAGEHVTYDWTYSYPGAPKPTLIDWPTSCASGGRYIARGGIVTVELTVISICFAMVFALFGALGRLSRAMSFKEAWDKYQQLGLHVRLAYGPHDPLLGRDVLHLAVPRHAAAAPDHRDLLRPSRRSSTGLHARYERRSTRRYPPAFVTGVAALSLNYGAYLTEVFRAGIQAVPKGQTEAPGRSA